MTGGVSLESYLRENYSIWWKRSRLSNGAFNFSLSSLRNPASLIDDELGTVGGAVIAAIREVYDEAKSLHWQPMVQTGHGLNVGQFVDKFNHDDFYDQVVGELASNEQLANEVHELLECRLDDQPSTIDKYKFVDALYSFYVKLRRVEAPRFTTRGDPIESCSMAEAMQVVLGSMKKSLKLDKPNLNLLVLANNAHGGTGEINAQGTELVFYGDYNPFKFLNSQYVALPNIEREPVYSFESQQQPSASAINVDVLTAALRENLPATANVSTAEARPECAQEPDVFEVAIQHLAEHCTEDPNKYNDEDKINIFFGSERVSDLCEKQGKKFFNRWFEQYEKKKVITFEKWFEHGFKFLKDERCTELSGNEAAILIAGQTLKRKGQVTIKFSGADRGIYKK